MGTSVSAKAKSAAVGNPLGRETSLISRLVTFDMERDVRLRVTLQASLPALVRLRFSGVLIDQTVHFLIHGLAFSVREGLRVMRRFHLTRSSIFAGVAGFGEDVVAFQGLWSRVSLPEVLPQSVERFWENDCFHGLRELGFGWFHVVVTFLVVVW